MAGEKVQLLSLWASPYVMRVEVALVVKGVDYENIPQELSNKSELLLSSNPVYKKVPVLLHNGKAVCESGIIVQYVDEAWPGAEGSNLLPGDAYGRAMARFWADFVDKKVFDALLGTLKASKGTEEEKKAAEENVVAVMSTLEEALMQGKGGEGPFFGGARLGLVDVMLVPLLVWLPAVEELAQLSLPWAKKLPRLEAWFAATKAHPAVAVLPEPKTITEFVVKVLLPRFAN
ncbi:hypothetical protein GOP47_0025221 [Adiantum capillus-veneris]|uniref:glutathione transferase n=1 Tax=Adiantum capillus-veneris TaxID=13818 RepID=A0A9D4U3A2_ADICA|nr:hypothetical protein GOP47_0024907 [Adiantum capillus-veneris]KAI5060801.1 hypothetical protein GOP47_0025221 [Adiantum capillus-veneris]